MGLTPIKADNLDASGHGFFTRMGGHSEGIYEGLNCGAGSDDDKNCVSLNREMVSRTFDLDKSKLVSVYQVHSPDAIHVTSAFEAVESTVSAMVELGADRGRIAACVGPCISQKAYEVGPEFVEEFADHDPAFTQYFGNGAGDRALFDLPRFVLDRLRAAGLEDVAWTGHCTYSDPEKFFSYRRSCHEKGSQPNVRRNPHLQSGLFIKF